MGRNRKYEEKRERFETGIECVGHTERDGFTPYRNNSYIGQTLKNLISIHSLDLLRNPIEKRTQD
ncbi:MAG: hypothetical protein WCK92_08055 [Bacteroidota bacterium]